MKKNRTLFRKRPVALLLAFLLLLALAACGGGGSGSATTPTPAPTPTPDSGLMTVDEYMEKIEGLNTAAGEFVSEAQAFMSNFSVDQAADEQKELVEKMRTVVTPFQEFAAIDNPPEGFDDAHAKVVEGSGQFASAISDYCDDLIRVIDGEDVDIDAFLETYTENSTKAIETLSAGITEVQNLANQ